jgi:tetratricopeptide (TPR) repeat protein
MPGLPIVFYTVIGLIWAQSRAGFENRGAESRNARLQGIGVLAATMVSAVAITLWAVGDFQGALGEQQARKLANKRQWEPAMDRAAGAQRMRLAIEGYLAAAYQYNAIGFEAAADRYSRMVRMLRRVRSRDSIPPNIRALAREDTKAFEHYGGRCLASGAQLLARVPGYPGVASRLAETLLMKQRLEVAQEKLGLIEKARPYTEAAYRWMRAEYEWDPYNPRAALSLFQLSANRPMRERLDVLRVPLRAGPRPAGGRADAFRVGQTRLMLDLFGPFEQALASLLEEEGFDTTFEALLAQAEAAVQSEDPATWPDPYVPETLRLGARHGKLTRRFDEAARLAGLAADAAERISDRFPTAVSSALIDQSRYLLLAYPAEAARSVAVCREAIDRWPAVGDRLRQLQLRESLAFYLLAAGQERAAREHLRGLASDVGQELTDAQLDGIIGHGLREVCSAIAGPLPPDQRPAWYRERLARSVALVPDNPETQMLAAFEDFREGESEAGIAHLKVMEEHVSDRRSFAWALQMARRAFPEDAALARFAKARLPGAATQTAPAGAPGPPATRGAATTQAG